jgi:hypothetical protein
MSRPEFESWAEFYDLYPFDDMHIHYRPAALIAQSMRGGELKPLLEWMQPPANDGEYSDADLTTLAAFGFKTEK